MAGFGKPREHAWYDGLVWAGVALAFAVAIAWTFFGQVLDARSSAPMLSPATLAEFDLDEHGERLVDVEGFEIDCDLTILEGNHLLALAQSPDRSAMVLVAFEHGSDCRESITELRGPFRAKAKLLPTELRSQLGIDAVGRKFVIVVPHEVRYWQAVLLAVFVAFGGFCVRSAFAARKQQLAKPSNEPALAPEASEADTRPSTDPYRPGKSGRLITETLTLAPAVLARLRRVRMIQIGLGVGIFAVTLIWASWSGKSIYEREQIWSKGVVAEDAIAEGRVRRSMLVAVSTDLEVSFVDRVGRLHREEASATSLFVGVDDSVPATVRYLPEDPEQFAVSWIHEQLWGSLAMVVIVAGGLLALGAVLVISGRRDRRPEQATAVFEDPREALLELIHSERQVVNGSDTGAITHHFRVCDSDRNWSHFVAVKEPGPLFLDDAKSLALALYHPRDPDYLMVLSEDLHELDRPTFSPAQLRARYQTGSSESSD